MVEHYFVRIFEQENFSFKAKQWQLDKVMDGDSMLTPRARTVKW